jgi:hypothetical protein
MKAILWRFLIITFGITILNAEQALFLARIKNETPETLYKVIIPDEDYEMLVPPGKEADFGQWLDLQRSKEVQLAAIGDNAGDPIFIKRGPEAAGCANDELGQSVIYWSGLPSADASQKNYKISCIKGDVELLLDIQPDGTPELDEIIETQQS